MQRTFNYTGRQKIEQGEAIFSFFGSEESPSFNVEFRFNSKKYPDDSSLYVEAYYKETRQRFFFGKTSKIVPPLDRTLTEIDLSGSTLFRVMVVDESGSHGLLLASGEAFRGDKNINNEQDRSSILAVVKKPMGQLTWKVEFEAGGIPELCINNNIPNAIDKMKYDPYFQSLILPAALRQVLVYFLWNETDEDDEICSKWMEFAKYFGEAKPDDDDPVRLVNWIDDVVSSFSQSFDMCDRLLSVIKEGK
ncbi:hypothetical protein [Dasania marina]|uniref:hypothetical protein n=1 Tax=Dasania marina TaxID=471499 RepID=UPI0030DB3E98|tara:strand:+ start:53669 stop:54415 length:747 start_codon:yes stop_codon:yes gene_type:complete